MISREDFVFTIGYEGATAVIDGRAKKECGQLSTMALAEAGLFRAAFASALYSGDESEMRAFIDFFNAKAGTSYETGEQLSRLFGVNLEKVSKVLVL